MTIHFSKVFIGYKEAKDLLKACGIRFTENLARVNSLLKSDCSAEFIKASYQNDYANMYKVARDKYDYNILLEEDESIIQIGYEKDSRKRVVELRYAFYEAPINILSYESFLKEHGLLYRDTGDLFYEEYEQYKNEASLKISVTPIRYDFSYNQYNGIIHPISHLHIGQSNNIRIPLSFIMTPKAFIAFILRHIYWEKWKYYVEDQNFKEQYLTAKGDERLDISLFGLDEQKDIYLV